MKIYAVREIWNDRIAIHIGIKNNSGVTSVAQPLIFSEQSHNLITDPCMQLEIQDAQLLMDELWHVGLRPSEGTGSAGSLAATQKHLKDMQEIAKGLLKKDGVNL